MLRDRLFGEAECPLYLLIVVLYRYADLICSKMVASSCNFDTSDQVAGNFSAVCWGRGALSFGDRCDELLLELMVLVEEVEVDSF